MAGHIANETDTKNAAEEYQKSALSLQGESGKRFIQTEVSPQPGDAILDLGCRVQESCLISWPGRARGKGYRC